MTDQIPPTENVPPEQPKGRTSTTSSTEAWREVGRQFQVLGESISEAFRVAIQNEENRKRFDEMRSGVESMAEQVSRTVQEQMNSERGQAIRNQASQVAGNVRQAGEQTLTEVRPHLVAALQQVNLELQKMIDRMEQENKPPKPPNPPEGPAA